MLYSGKKAPCVTPSHPPTPATCRGVPCGAPFFIHNEQRSLVECHLLLIWLKLDSYHCSHSRPSFVVRLFHVTIEENATMNWRIMLQPLASSRACEGSLFVGTTCCYGRDYSVIWGICNNLEEIRRSEIIDRHEKFNKWMTKWIDEWTEVIPRGVQLRCPTIEGIPGWFGIACERGSLFTRPKMKMSSPRRCNLWVFGQQDSDNVLSSHHH